MYLKCDDDALDNVPVQVLDVRLKTSSTPGSTSSCACMCDDEWLVGIHQKPPRVYTT